MINLSYIYSLPHSKTDQIVNNSIKSSEK